jgi:hypothetical protein
MKLESAVIFKTFQQTLFSFSQRSKAGQVLGKRRVKTDSRFVRGDESLGVGVVGNYGITTATLMVLFDGPFRKRVCWGSACANRRKGMKTPVNMNWQLNAEPSQPHLVSIAFDSRLFIDPIR